MGRAEREISSSLQARLESAMAGAAPKRTVIGRSTNGRRAFAAVGQFAGSAETAPLATGCATKLLVAALLERKLGAHGLGHDVPIRHVLDAPGAAFLGETTLRHLLEHRHGLDDSALGAAPRRADGRICLVRLLALLGERRFAAPGALYSYSNAGAWMVAALLEALERRRFDEQLRDDLLAPLGIAIHDGDLPHPLGIGIHDGHPLHRPSARTLCPATGGPLALSAEGLLTFLDACAPRAPAQQRARRRRSDGARAATVHDAAPLPGWHPLERGVRLGWKCYDGGWFGHQSTWPGASLLLRVRPGDRSALVVASESHHAAVVAARVLGRELPELRALALPRPLSAEAAARLNLASRCGRYAVAGESVEIELDGKGLALRSGRLRTALIPAADEIFFLQEGGPSRSFVQFIERDENAFRGLWDGRRVLPLADPMRGGPAGPA